MANVTAAMVQELREMTGAGMKDCKKAIGETNGDMRLLNILERTDRQKRKRKQAELRLRGFAM